MAKYKCPTLGDCDRANAGEVFERAPGEDLKCPGCSTLLEAQAGPNPTGGKPKLLVPLVAAAVVVIGAGAYLFLKPQPEMAAEAVAQAEAPAAAPVQTEAVAPQEARTGIAPSDAETAAQRRQSEQALVAGKASEAESAGSQAAANEMLKVAIAKMAQGKLDEAEKELLAARLRAPKQPLVYYNMAVLRLKQARTDDALKEFEGAFLAGFSHFREMDADTDLDQLRKDPRFDKLVKQYRPAGA
ncbi:hypothetical protein [Massilia sp. X63]|jgi:tetratricopeptide (TPR) repeat protein|uniref:TPR end-of-group domain-containing protein n=1 Tax=Massilia sp. X63 TaxID=3237285 RepID=UPI0034DD1768